MIEDLEIVGSAWGYTLPAFPDFRRHNFKESDKKNYFPY
jgi:hypothetical protein